MKFSSLAALEVVKMTTSSAASDENFVKMTSFSFQWSVSHRQYAHCFIMFCLVVVPWSVLCRFVWFIYPFSSGLPHQLLGNQMIKTHAYGAPTRSLRRNISATAPNIRTFTTAKNDRKSDICKILIFFSADNELMPYLQKHHHSSRWLCHLT